MRIVHWLTGGRACAEESRSVKVEELLTFLHAKMEDEIARLLNATSSDKLRLQQLMQEYLQLDESASGSESDSSADEDDTEDETEQSSSAVTDKDPVFDMTASEGDLILKGATAGTYPVTMSDDCQQEYDKASKFRYYLLLFVRY